MLSWKKLPFRTNNFKTQAISKHVCFNEVIPLISICIIESKALKQESVTSIVKYHQWHLQNIRHQITVGNPLVEPLRRALFFPPFSQHVAWHLRTNKNATRLLGKWQNDDNLFTQRFCTFRNPIAEDDNRIYPWILYIQWWYQTDIFSTAL